MAGVITSSQIAHIKKRGIFFDANIILYLFWPSNPQLEDEYSGIFGKILRQKNDMYVDFIVLSEVVNRVVRIEHRKYIQRMKLNVKKMPFKKYRNIGAGKEVINDIYQIIQKRIFPLFEITGKEFTRKDINGFLNIDSLDFNDKAIASICKENDFVLITHDSDFASCKLDILTANNKIIANVKQN